MACLGIFMCMILCVQIFVLRSIAFHSVSRSSFVFFFFSLRHSVSICRCVRMNVCQNAHADASALICVASLWCVCARNHPVCMHVIATQIYTRSQSLLNFAIADSFLAHCVCPAPAQPDPTRLGSNNPHKRSERSEFTLFQCAQHWF